MPGGAGFLPSTVPLVLWDLTFAFKISFSDVTYGIYWFVRSGNKGHTWRIIPFSKR